MAEVAEWERWRGGVSKQHKEQTKIGAAGERGSWD